MKERENENQGCRATFGEGTILLGAFVITISFIASLADSKLSGAANAGEISGGAAAVIGFFLRLSSKININFE